FRRVLFRSIPHIGQDRCRAGNGRDRHIEQKVVGSAEVPVGDKRQSSVQQLGIYPYIKLTGRFPAQRKVTHALRPYGGSNGTVAEHYTLWSGDGLSVIVVPNIVVTT